MVVGDEVGVVRGSIDFRKNSNIVGDPCSLHIFVRAKLMRKGAETMEI